MALSKPDPCVCVIRGFRRLRRYAKVSRTFPDASSTSLCRLVAVRVHGDDRREIADVEVPHRLGRAELHQRHAVDALDAARVELRRAADRVQVDRA